MTRLLVVVMRDVAGLIMDGFTILGHDTGLASGWTKPAASRASSASTGFERQNNSLTQSNGVTAEGYMNMT